MLGQNGHSAGADLVGRVPVGGHPVAAHKAGLDESPLHHHGGHIVTDEGHIHPRLLQLPGGEPGPLEEGPGLVGKHVQGDSPLVSQKDGTQGSAVFRGGKGSRITVGQHPVPRLQEGQAVLGDFLAHLLVLPADGPGLLPQGGDNLLHRRTGHPGGQVGEPPHRPGQVYRCGAGADKYFSLSVYLIQKGGAGHPLLHELPGQHVQAVPGKDADGGGAPHPQGLDGLHHVREPGHCAVLHPVGQLALVQQDHAAVPLPQADVEDLLFFHVSPPSLTPGGRRGAHTGRTGPAAPGSAPG